MSDCKTCTLADLAEVIADQAREIRHLCDELDKQNDVIVEYELEQENEERVNAEMANELIEAIQCKAPVERFQEIFDTYFKEYE